MPWRDRVRLASLGDHQAVIRQRSTRQLKRIGAIREARAMTRQTVSNRKEMMRWLAAIALMLTGAGVSHAQWPGVPPRGLPRTSDGRIDVTAPPPRTPEGKPDLSGVWEPAPDPAGRAGGVEGVVAPRYMIDITIDQKPDAVPFQPWAAALYKERNDRARIDNPNVLCLPPGVPRLVAYLLPYKIVQTPDLIVILYEAGTIFRQIFMDGRMHPADPQPTWMGYSVGRWEGDDLVVDTRGFNDQSWLDGAGHPHSADMRVTERFTRRTVGQMDIAVTIDDPKAYARPLTYTQRVVMRPDTELIEFVCENPKPISSDRK
jgi:hypothetical protein